MGTATFFIKASWDPAPLGDVAKKVFQSLGINEWEERFSANYPPDEHYFAGYAENAVIKVSDYDVDPTPVYPFAISVANPTRRVGSGIIVTDPQKIAVS